MLFGLIAVVQGFCCLSNFNLCLLLSNSWSQRFMAFWVGCVYYHSFAEPIMWSHRDKQCWHRIDILYAVSASYSAHFFLFSCFSSNSKFSVSSFPVKKFNIHVFWNPISVVQQFKASISQFSFTQWLQNLTPHSLELERWLVTRQLKLQ